jgi:hypothetical protein
MRPARAKAGISAALAAGAVALFLLAAPVSAMGAVHPAGGGTFDGGAQGWRVTAASCDVPASCTAGGGYDDGNGNPPGSFVAQTNVALNLVTVFRSNVTLQSPDFRVSGDASDATLHLDRQFSAGALVDQQPQAAYTVTLLDRTAGTESELLVETLSPADSSFVGKDAAARVKPGHRYAISIEVETSSTVAGSGLLSGSTFVRFDNAALSVRSGVGGRGRNGKSGSGSALSDARLRALLRSGSGAGVAVIKGKRLLVKVSCPRKVGRACRIAAQGLLRKGKPATTKRTVKVGPGKSRRIFLRVKPKLRAKVAKRKRLLVRERVRAGKAKATVYRQRKLIRR